MVVTSIKNFFKSLGFYFVPIGVMAFIILITLAYMVPAATNVVRNTYEQIANVIGKTDFDWNQIARILSGKIANMVEGDPNAIVNMLVDQNALVAFLAEVAKEAFGLESISNEIFTIIQNGVAEISVMILGLIAVVFLSFFIAFIILNVILRSNLTGSNIFKAILTSLIDGILVVVALFVILTVYNKGLIVLTWVIGAIFLLLMVIISLLEAYLFFARKKVPFKQIFNLKNMLYLFLGDLICIAIGGGLVALCFLIKNPFVAFFVAIPFIELVVSLLGLNADSYASMIVKEGKILKRAEIKMQKEAK